MARWYLSPKPWWENILPGPWFGHPKSRRFWLFWEIWRGKGA